MLTSSPRTACSAPDPAQSLEYFGAALAHGDFNDDGITDLAIGAPGEVPATGPAVHGGGVAVVYGAPGGLGDADPAVLITQASPGVPGAPEELDAFGAALAAGDFNGNGVTDLAVGVPGENAGAGIVQVLRGEAGTGLGVLPATTFSQNTPGVPGGSESGDEFGEALAAGDVTGDSRDDLAVGVPGENGLAGAVNFLPGSVAGLTGTGSQYWSQNSPGVEGVAAQRRPIRRLFGDGTAGQRRPARPRCGRPVRRDRIDRNAGSVTVLLGRPTGLSTAEAGGSRFHQGTVGIAGSPEPGDGFGSAVAAPFIQTTDLGSLVVGVPGEKVGTVAGTGMLHQLMTFEFGPNPIGSVSLHLDTPGVKGRPGVADYFGFDVA